MITMSGNLQVFKPCRGPRVLLFVRLVYVFILNFFFNKISGNLPNSPVHAMLHGRLCC